MQLAALLAAHGAEFIGLQESPRGMLVLFNDPLTSTTLALPETEFTSESLARRLRESRERHIDTSAR